MMKTDDIFEVTEEMATVGADVLVSWVEMPLTISAEDLARLVFQAMARHHRDQTALNAVGVASGWPS